MIALAGNGPLMPEVGVLALPYHRWGTHWMTPHHVLPRLAHYFHVLWLEPAHHWRQIGSARTRPHPLAGANLPDGFDVYVPEIWLPDIYSPRRLRDELLRQRVRRGFARLRARGCRTLVLYLWFPTFEAALRTPGRHLSVYHIDDEYAFATDGPAIGPQEARVLQHIDQVIVHSPGLLERKRGINPNMAMVPEGVDSELYARAAIEPADLAPIAHPRIGYTGTLKRHLDWDLLRALARRHPQWSFVYVGPRSLKPDLNAIVDEMAGMPNVHLLGPKTVSELAAYPQHFDVCIMPYLVNGYTNAVYPLKLHEYLAAGRPVVGSRIRSLLDFNDVIELASGLDEWSAAITRALHEATTAKQEAARALRQGVARKHDWSELIFQIAEIVATRLGPPFATKLARVNVSGVP